MNIHIRISTPIIGPPIIDIDLKNVAPSERDAVLDATTTSVHRLLGSIRTAGRHLDDSKLVEEGRVTHEP